MFRDGTVMFFGGVIATVIFFIIVGLFASLIHDDKQDLRISSFEQQCSQFGGHIYKPDTTSWCLNLDGGIIEVYP